MGGLELLLDDIAIRGESETSTLTGDEVGDFSDAHGLVVFRCALARLSAGAVIGNKGDKIKSLRESTGASIIIEKQVEDEHQMVRICGDRKQVMTVLEDLNQSVQGDVEKDWFVEWAAKRELWAPDSEW